jgi:hypothetical protein
MTGLLMRRERNLEIWGEDGHVKMEAEIGVMLPPAKEQ